MKISSAIIIGWAAGICGLHAQTPGAAASQVNIPPPTDYHVVQQDGNSQVWQRERYEQGADGQITTNEDKYTELATGLNHLVDGKWVPSDETISILPDGTGAATNGQHQVFFPANIYEGVIELVTPDGKHLKSQPSALAYDDGSNTVLIAVLTNSIGEIVNDNQVVYSNAFNGLDADLVYTYRKSGFEQDVVLHEQPTTPDSLGLNAATARLQVLTEFFDPPQPGQTANTLAAQAGVALSDTTLDFGVMRMVQGRAFMLGESSPAVRVGKSWVTLEGRYFLVEAVPVMAMADDLEGLPSYSGQTASSRKTHIVFKKLRVPTQHLAAISNHPLKRLAKMNATWEQGLVLDYNTVNTSQTNFTFQGDTTYYLSGNVSLFGTNTFEGGAVIKYASGVSLSLPTTLTKFVTSQYWPIIFTAKDDNTIGETVTGSSGNPSGYYANPALGYAAPGSISNFSNFRIAYAKEGISLANLSQPVSCGQFVNCQNGLVINSGSVDMENMLFENVQTNVYVESAGGGGFGENITVSGGSCLLLGGSDASAIYTNSIFVNMQSLTNGEPRLSGGQNGFYNSPEFGTDAVTNTFYPFQTVGTGNCYLTNGCLFHNAGTTNIDPVLLANLAGETTYPPLVYSNVILSVNTTLSPQVQRDNTGAPDLGYHYYALDYIFGGCDLFSNLTFTAGTAVGWFESQGTASSSGQPYAISLNKGSSLIASGTATAPCWITCFQTTQEGNGNWPGDGYMGCLMPASGGSGAAPLLNTTFTKWSTIENHGNYFRDNYEPGFGTFANNEFYTGSLITYDTSGLYFTNCLTYRSQIYLYDQTAAPIFTVNNCTFYNGALVGSRTSGQNPFWTIENNAFDGTAFRFTDYYDGNTNYMCFNFNAYNTNNLAGLTYSFPYGATTNFLEVIGPNDVMVTNYQWQSSWFGDFYLPPDSPLIQVGSTNANLLGLYHFTTQTNQTVEGDSIVDIGYHYVATDTNGLPLDSNGDGVPDYLEDANGNGLVDDGELNWTNTGAGLNVLISRPQNGSTLP